MAKKTIKSVNLLPEFLRTDKNSKFLSSTIDQLIQQPKLERIDGYIGSKITPTYNAITDNYISKSNTLRDQYQLEPALVINDENGDPKEVRSIDDVINELKNQGGNVEQFTRLFKSKTYAFDPHIDWDKFVNYQNYYWLTTGPDTITIVGNSNSITSTYTVGDNSAKTAWVFTPDGLTENPLITLYRGSTYKFEINSIHRFYIKTSLTLGTDSAYTGNITNNGVSNGTITLTIDDTTPDVLYFASDNILYALGRIVIKNPYESASINVEEEIIGKKDYQSGTGISLSNGMKIKFSGNVYPEKYRDREFFVEGVGRSIKLIEYSLLTSSEAFTTYYDDDFDATEFDSYPFDTFKQIPIDPEYITINRASSDLNPWSRYNRWVHADIIKISAEILNKTPIYPANKRAFRPIIEFAADLKLFNFGTTGVRNVDLIDTETTDAFSYIEGSAGYYVDGVLLEQGHRVIFNSDADADVRGKIYEVNYVIINNDKRLELVDTLEVLTPGSVLSVNLGLENSGKNWWFNGNFWIYAQQRSVLNQPPLFDLFDKTGNTYTAGLYYDSTFNGNKIFGYKIGNGVADKYLGISLQYKNNDTGGEYLLGSVLFENYFNTTSFSITVNNQTSQVPPEHTYCMIGGKLTNIWNETVDYEIPAVQIKTLDIDSTMVEMDAIQFPTLENCKVDVYINSLKLSDSEWSPVVNGTRYYIAFNSVVPASTNILIKVRSKNQLNNGWFEPPLNLTHNPLNGPLPSVSLSDISDHFKTMTEGCSAFVGKSYGLNNARDISNISQYGTRLISNATPMAFTNFFLCSREHNALDAISKSADQYNQFKNSFLRKLSDIIDQTIPSNDLDTVLLLLNKDRDLNSPWYSSDMVGYGTDKTVRVWEVTDARNIIYPLSQDFTLTELTNKSVLVYLNNTQLLNGTEYTFIDNGSSVEILAQLQVGDKIEIRNYYNTDGSYIPSTPTKLGLYPKYEPKKYLDTTYTQPVNVIQGHDGSIIVAFDDYRDELILELEKRIYNNIKVSFDPDSIGFYTLLPGMGRESDYTNDEIIQILQRDFVKWSGINSVDYETNETFDSSNPFTWKFSDATCNATGKLVNGNWRSIYKYFYDTDRPHTHPWEMLGFTERPVWWESEYGPAPYTSNNFFLWSDLSNGVIKLGERAGVDNNFIRPWLSSMLPVTPDGTLVSPETLVSGYTSYGAYQKWKFGDNGPVETAWRRSSYWPFAMQRLLALTTPSKYFSLMYDTSRNTKNVANQRVYGVQGDGKFLSLKTVSISGNNAEFCSGYSVYISEIGRQRATSYLNTLKDDLTNLNLHLFYKVGGFVGKDKLQIVIDAIDPNSISSGALLPQEDFKLILNKGNPIKTSSISGIIIQKANGKFVLKGYDLVNPYFTVMGVTRTATTPTINVGGFSAPFVNWEAQSTRAQSGLSSVDLTTAVTPSTGQYYQSGQIVKYNNKFYRVNTSHRATEVFNSALFQAIPALPVVGGATVQAVQGYSTDIKQVAYGTAFSTIQEVYDVIIGYGKWLETQGFIFDEYNFELLTLIDWNLSAKEFLYWTTQNWANNSVISLSPFSSKLKYSLPNSVVDNIFDSFYEYNILKTDGLPLPAENINVIRSDGVCTIESVNTTDGIYFAKLSSVQKEHAMVFNNTTVFKDVIYDIETGFKQQRVKLIGFKTASWDGDYFSPGFIYDAAIIKPWKENTNYKYGDVVKFNNFYYSATRNIDGARSFNEQITGWVLLGEKPVAELLPNFDYKITQFEDFYSLDIDNFDVSQQKMAQHAIGYTPRPYLNNIFTNPISQYKFYQGYIKEKGTKNSVKRMSKASVHNAQGELDFTEEWAFRVGNYGSFSSFEELETVLTEGSFIENPQIINFVSDKPLSPSDLINYSLVSNLSITPTDYDVENTFLTTNTNAIVLPTAGYVNFNDITATAYNENSLLDIANNSEINNHDVIWLGFKQNGQWDVLQYTLSESRVVGVFVSNPLTDITFVTDTFHNLSVGDIISITNFNDQVNGVYVVKLIPKLNYITVSSTIVSITNSELLTPGLLYKFASVRVSSYDNLPKDSQMLRLPVGTKFWVDNEASDGSLNWEIYRKSKAYFDGVAMTQMYNSPNQQFGYSVAVNNNALVVGAPSFSGSVDYSRVVMFDKSTSPMTKKFSFTLNSNGYDYCSVSSSTGFGKSVIYTSDNFDNTNYGLIIVGAPTASNTKVSGSGIKFSDGTGPESTKTEEGLVKVSSVDSRLIGEVPQVVLLSPELADYQHFGESIFAANGFVFVGAPSAVSTGTVYMYQTFTPVSSTRVVKEVSSATTEIHVESITGVNIGDIVRLPSAFNNVIDGVRIIDINSENGNAIISLSSSTTAAITSGTRVYFYNDTDVIQTQGIYTATGGLVISYLGKYTHNNAASADGNGASISGSLNATVIAVGAPKIDQVSVYSGVTPTPIQTIVSPYGTGSNFGSAITVSDNGDLIVISAPVAKNDDNSVGKVAIYTKVNGSYTLTQTISNPVSDVGMVFGKSISLVDNTLIITSLGKNTSITNQFDSGETTFDVESTEFFNVADDFGTVYVFNKHSLGSRFVLAEELTTNDTDLYVDAGSTFGACVVADNTDIIVGAPALLSQTTSTIYRFNKDITVSSSLELYRSYDSLVDADTIQRVSLIDTHNESVVEYLDVIDPVKGKIAGIADQEMTYKSAFDPAVYSIGVAGTVNDTDTNWLDEHVGELWWDLSTVKYVWYEQGDLSYRKNNWGKLFPGATIDVYEWVGSNYLPSEWSTVADTAAGLTQGISGQPKYPDNSVISVKQIYNNITNSFTNYYFYWVKNKVTIPAVKNRRVSAYQVSALIADPVAYGVKFAAFIEKNAVAVANINSQLVSNNISLNIAYDNLKNSIPKHTEWQLLEEGSSRSMPPAILEKKLIDSLLGHDSLGNLVPDPQLSERTKYGVEIRPRQSMFKDRKQALRNVIEFVNDVLINNQITSNYDFINLNQQEQYPDEFSREYDVLVEDNEGLEILDTSLLKQAAITCTVGNGKIRSVSIIDTGYGYSKPPKVTINSTSGVGAEIYLTIDSLGRVDSASIISEGSGYITAPALSVRPYTAIVISDSAYNGKWTKFSWSREGNRWERTQTQRYNTPLYWKYVDWQANTSIIKYNEFIDYTHTIDNVYQLDTIEEISVGQYVKVKNVGDGRYVILEKTAGYDAGTFGKGYNLVYKQDGTIQILDSIWDFDNSNFAFDNANNYDQTLYDQTPDLELYYILLALKENIFVGELKTNWNLLFFKSVKYALTEQKLLNWAFKTSFINVTNYAGLLDQRPVYKIQDSKNYEDYLSEVKPYHSQIRTFTANHQLIDPTNSFTTDFDLPAVYNRDTKRFESVNETSSIIDQYPWKAWADNFLYGVGSVSVGHPGSGYTYPPQVIITTADGDSGSGAAARAYIKSGQVYFVEVTNPGSGYRKPPSIVLYGGGGSNLVSAVAYAQLSNNKVRTNKVGIKFDRISDTRTIGDTVAVDSFFCDGSANEFNLTWVAEPNKSTITAKVDGELVLSANYTVKYYNQVYGGYTKTFCKFVFVESVPSSGQVLEVEYRKNIQLFNALERIQNHYYPTAGMPGTDAAQLMTGIEYNNSVITGLPFDYTSSWDLIYSQYGKSIWSDDVSFYKMSRLTSPVSPGATSIYIDDIDGIVPGQYINCISTITNVFSTTTVYVTSVTTATKHVEFNGTIVNSIDDISSNLVFFEFWSYDPAMNTLDTVVEGGSWNTSMINATGVSPSEIIVSGDDFINAAPNQSPEELVAGFVSDTISINVYTRSQAGAPLLFSGNVDIYENTTTTVDLIILPPNKDSIVVTFDNRVFTYTTDRAFTTATNASLFGVDWDTGQLVVGPQSNIGKLGYNIVGVGGSQKNLDTGFIDYASIITNVDDTEAQLQSVSSFDTVKGAYVTVNGTIIDEVTTNTDYGYVIEPMSSSNNRASVHVYNLSTGSSTVQAWFFGTPEKVYNEFREQRFNVSGPQQTFILDYPPSTLKPEVVNCLVEVKVNGVFRRLQSPLPAYYTITDSNNLTYLIDKNIGPHGPYQPETVRVYVNGIELVSGADYEVGETHVTFRIGRISVGDEICILAIPFAGVTPGYDLEGNILTLRFAVSNTELRVITFANHDTLKLTSERFIGSLNRRYNISRPVYNDKFIWVEVNGAPLVNNVDFKILDNALTIELSDLLSVTSSDFVTITTFSETPLAETVIGYRIFNDIFDRTHFKRLSKKNTTYLTKPLEITDTEIHVADSSVLSMPVPLMKIPGVILVDSERIEFFKVEGNILKDIKRSTLGTGPGNYLQVGTKVLDQSLNQTIPYSEISRKQVILTSKNTSTYPISTVDFTSTIATGGSQLLCDGIVLQVSSNDLHDAIGQPVPLYLNDQLTVYYGDRLLNKSGSFYHDTTVSYDSPEFIFNGFTSSVAELPPTTNIGDAFVVTATNKVWVYNNSKGIESYNGYEYTGLTYNPPEFYITASIDTTTALVYYNTATQIVNGMLPVDLSYDINGDGVVTLDDVAVFYKLSQGDINVGIIDVTSKYADLIIQRITLNIDIEDDVQLTLVKKDFNKVQSWCDIGKSLIESTSTQAKFLQSRPAELPDNSYYGGTTELSLPNGTLITDENNNTLEGF